MSIDEAARHRLFNRAAEVLGQEEAEILMAHLPPGGWPNLATKQDILSLRQELLALEPRIVGQLKAYTLRTVLVANLGMVGVFAGIAFTAAGFGS
ncbi:MAG TPA: hypothetical protein VHL78_07160 [Actinomycetota bacterium]|nr:hypothetical protein [Actinomycetota bacterium]